MTPEEMQRNIEFIVEHLAQLAVRQDALQTRQEAMQTQMEAMQTQMAGMQTQLSAVSEAVVSNAAVIQKLAQVQITMGEAQRATDERLNTLIVIVEKLVSRNGGHA